METKWLLGIIQNSVADDKKVNIHKASEMIEEAANRGAKVAVLPEMFNCPYDSKLFAAYAEEFPGGETTAKLGEMAKKKNIYVFGGSIPERYGDTLYNTCYVFAPDGSLVARHRKVHLFDVELSEGLIFKESDTLGAGDSLTVVDTEYGKIGVAICYDIRFPEVARALTISGANLMVVPAAFNMITGPAHWEITMRMRAVDNQMYVAGVAPARNEKASYVTYGHSILVEPFGRVIDKLDEKEGIIIGEIDLQRLEQVRRELPLLKHRRPDIY